VARIAAIPESGDVAEREMMLRRADRSAIERGHHQATVVAVGPDIDHKYEAEHRGRQECIS
jgi:hypothetical protein